MLELVETQAGYPFEIPEMVAEMINGSNAENAQTRVAHSKSDCSNCHEGGVQGEHLKQEIFLTISGEELNVTESLYHYRRSDLFRPDDLLGLRLRQQRGKQPASDEIRFTWEKGSFKVKPSTAGQVVVSLDEIAHEGNIHVTADKGTLILHPTIKPY